MRKSFCFIEKFPSVFKYLISLSSHGTYYYTESGLIWQKSMEDLGPIYGMNCFN
jgi:hypothetical protein